MSHKHTYIEFVGQHSAGKTTTIQQIVDKHLLAPLDATYPQKLKRNQLHFLASLPLLFIQNTRHTWFLMRFLLRNAKRNWINYHAVARHLFKMIALHPYYDKMFAFDVMLKDDMLHLLPRIEFRDGVDVAGAFTTFVSHFAHRYNGLVYMEVSYEKMKERFEERFQERPRSRRKSREQVYERAYKQNKILKRVLLEQREIPILVLNGEDAINENTEKVTHFIRTNIHD